MTITEKEFYDMLNNLLKYGNVFGKNKKDEQEINTDKLAKFLTDLKQMIDNNQDNKNEVIVALSESLDYAKAQRNIKRWQSRKEQTNNKTLPFL